MLTEIRQDSIDFCHKQQMFGLVLMVRTAVPDGLPGTWCWGGWRIAQYFDLARYERMSK